MKNADTDYWHHTNLSKTIRKDGIKHPTCTTKDTLHSNTIERQCFHKILNMISEIDKIKI